MKKKKGIILMTKPDEEITREDVNRVVEEMLCPSKEPRLMVPVAAREDYMSAPERAKESSYTMMNYLIGKGHNCWME